MRLSLKITKHAAWTKRSGLTFPRLLGLGMLNPFDGNTAQPRPQRMSPARFVTAVAAGDTAYLSSPFWWESMKDLHMQSMRVRDDFILGRDGQCIKRSRRLLLFATCEVSKTVT